MRVLVVGGGGREHALCWKLRQSPRLSALYCAPGNAGIADIAEIVPIGARERDRLVEWAREQRIDLVVVGPDDPLADGLVDALRERGVAAFGPTRAAAELEWSKSWAKQFCRQHDIPTAAWAVFESADEAHAYVDSMPEGVVVKADGLAAGKGVTVCLTRSEAHAAVDRCLVESAFGAAGARVVIEERLVGRELSATAICDGSTYRMLPLACDHKAVGDGNRGPNTGGMGTYSPPLFASDALVREVELRIVAPTVRAMARQGRPFVGFLYPGLMLTDDGLRVIEFNARLGDPEAQVLLPRLGADLLELLDRAVHGRLAEAPTTLPLEAGAACCVILASAGYPGAYQVGRPIAGLDAAAEGALIFHAGTRRCEGRIETDGGRVLGVTAVADDVATARQRAYAGVERVHFDGRHFRRDIGST